MELSDLLTFSTVARLGGITRAADELNTVQSNVTQRVKALEAEIGTALFERHSRGMTLTGAGRRLLPYAQRMAALSREALLAARVTMANRRDRSRSDRWKPRRPSACPRCSPNSIAASRRCD
jgi:DNA-binding transcriptional LysR family regulator